MLLTSQAESTFASQFERRGAILPDHMVLIECQSLVGERSASLSERMIYSLTPFTAQVITTVYHHRCLALVTLDMPEYYGGTFSATLNKIADKLQCHITVSPYYTNPSDTLLAAQACAEATTLKTATDPVVFCEDKYFDLLLTQVPHWESTLPAFMSPAFKAIIDYDNTNKTSLLKTVKTYLYAAGNLTTTANTLFIHPNTLRGRIQRIEELTRLDLHDAETCYRLANSLAVHRFLVENHILPAVPD